MRPASYRYVMTYLTGAQHSPGGHRHVCVGL